MKINVKLFLLTFSIITLISVSSAFIYHTLTQKLLQSQQSKALVNSANDFIFVLQNLIENIENDFANYSNKKLNINSYENLDFVFKINEDSTISKDLISKKEKIKIYYDVLSLKEFLDYNSNLLVRKLNTPKGIYFYGMLLSPSKIDEFSQKIRAEVALVEGDVVSIFSNSAINQYYLPDLSRFTRELKNKNNFELINESMDEVDFSVTHFSPKSLIVSNAGIDFLIFSISNEASNLKSTMNLVMVIIVVAGILLTIVFIFLFTTNFRKQLEYISKGVKNITEGGIKEKVKVVSSDELGKLGNTFNNMVEEIEKRDILKKEYSEFIALINQNPTLDKLGETALQKIISSTNVEAGALYIYNKNQLKQLAVFGISNNDAILEEESSFYKKAKEKRGLVEITFNEKHPVIKTGITELKINHLYILPIYHSNQIIAVLELAAINKPDVDVSEYLDRIKDQLAIGLANGKARKALQLLVDELQLLNNAYQEQNNEITIKNDELVKLHKELKQRSKELEVQTKKAIESEKIKSQFLANMSHELRTPQNAILGLTEVILKDDSTSVENKRKLNVVLRNGKKLLTLIENILEYSRIESGNLTTKMDEIILADLISEVHSFISPLFIESDVDFNIESFINSNIKLKTDVKKVEQIIYNLVGNAAKFTEKGYVNLKFDIKDEKLIFEVEDNGPGIPEEFHEIIFQEFRQADGDLSRKYDGTGLGLAICKKYTQLLNGTIELNSVFGKGSTFTVSLPVEIEPVKAFIAEDNTVTNNCRIRSLVISDSENAVKLIGDYLKSYDIIVESLSIEDCDAVKISQSSFDIIILDILSSSVDGWRILNEFKAEADLMKTPLVILNMDEEANCGLGLNVFQYVLHELEINSLYSTIEEIEDIHAIKFRKILFIMDEIKFNSLKKDLIHDDLEYFQIGMFGNNKDSIKLFDPDIIVADLSEKNINAFDIIAKINNDYYLKDVPILGYLSLDDSVDLSNKLIETTLQHQFHPLDVMKVIKERLELVDNSIFEKDKTITDGNNRIENIIIGKNSLSSDNIKVLIVDDDPDARFTIGEIIKSYGLEVEFAIDGFDCLKKLKHSIPDLILLDIMMPKMDGFQTIKRIKEVKELKEIPVYALTAYAMLSDKEIIEKNGFCGLITKPINTIQLERKLNSIFNMAL